MSRAVSRAAVLVALAVSGIAGAQEEEYTDTDPYVVQSKYPYVVYPSSYQMDNNYSWETGTYAFNPNQTYNSSQQQTIIQDEVGLSGGEVYLDWTDGMQVISVNQGSIPEASQQNAPWPTEMLPSGSSVPATSTFHKSYYRSEHLGNNIFGAGYTLDSAVTATPATSTAAKKVEARADGKVYAVAFNYQREIVRGRANISGQQGGANSGSAAVFAMGQQIWSANLSYSFNPTPINWSRTFFSASKTFMVGPVPITVRASVAGGVKLTVSGEISPTVARLSATPGGWGNVTASAAVNIIVARFGVEGSLTLINVSLPARGELFWPVCTLDWVIRTDLSLNTLSGNLKLFAEIRFLFFKKKWTATIASWTGYTRNWVLVNLSGSQQLGICS